MSLLEQDTNRKGRVDENVTEFEAGNNGKYEVEGIRNSAVYAKESVAGHLPGLYYLISWNGYPKEENIWEPALAVEHLWKLLSAFYKDKPNKPISTSSPSDTVLPMAQSLVVPLTKTIKQKRGQPAATNTRKKKAKKS